MPAIRAPFPWRGGKSRVAPRVWARLGDVDVYAEPFAGSLAVLLGRELDAGRKRPAIETVNDLDGFVANAWRAILHDPERTAAHADWPAHESDLHARHAWLVERRADLTRRLEGDPEYHDARIAGWWLWSIAHWLGVWGVGQGPWSRVEVSPGDWQLLRRGRTRGGAGVWRSRVHLGNAGQGVARPRVDVREWLLALASRLRRVRVCVGEWDRILTPVALASACSGVRGIFLDPPYTAAAGRARAYSVDSHDVAHAVRRWCETAPADYRIALCGYVGDGHEALESRGWTCERWTAQGGMQRDSSGGNRFREAIWYSPACVP